MVEAGDGEPQTTALTQLVHRAAHAIEVPKAKTVVVIMPTEQSPRPHPVKPCGEVGGDRLVFVCRVDIDEVERSNWYFGGRCAALAPADLASGPERCQALTGPLEHRVVVGLRDLGVVSRAPRIDREQQTAVPASQDLFRELALPYPNLGARPDQAPPVEDLPELVPVGDERKRPGVATPSPEDQRPSHGRLRGAQRTP